MRATSANHKMQQIFRSYHSLTCNSICKIVSSAPADTIAVGLGAMLMRERWAAGVAATGIGAAAAAVFSVAVLFWGEARPEVDDEDDAVVEGEDEEDGEEDAGADGEAAEEGDAEGATDCAVVALAFVAARATDGSGALEDSATTVGASLLLGSACFLASIAALRSAAIFSRIAFCWRSRSSLRACREER